MAKPTCGTIKLPPRKIADLDEDGLPEKLFIYKIPRDAAASFDHDCFEYRVRGEDSYCPAESAVIPHDSDGFPSKVSFLRLSSGTVFNQLKVATDSDGRKFMVGQKVIYWKFFGRPLLTGKIDQFHAFFTPLADGSVQSRFYADMKLDDGSVKMYIPLKDLALNDTWSQMKRGLSKFYWQSRADIESFIAGL